MASSVSAIDDNITQSSETVKDADFMEETSYVTDTSQSNDNFKQNTISKQLTDINKNSVDDETEVVKKNASITIDPIETTAYNENITITGTFQDANNNPLYNSLLTANLNGKTIKIKTDNNGTYTITTKATTIGTNNLTISHPGNNYYNPTNTTTTYNTNKRNLTITLNPVKLSANYENITVSGLVTDNTGNPVINTRLNLTINDKFTTIKTDGSGLIEYVTAADILEVNNLTLSFAGNTYYDPYELETTFEDPDIRLSNSDINPGVSKTFLALAPNDAEGSAVFKINQNTISPKLDLTYGMILYTYEIPSSFQSEEYLLELTYSGDSKYMGKTVNATLTLMPVGGRVNADMNMENFTITYLTKDTITVTLNEDAFGVIALKANDTNITTAKFSNGSFVYEYATHLVPGVYNLTATYNGNYKYLHTVTNSTLTVNKINSTISMKDISSKAGNKTLFTATVLNGLEQPVNRMNVTFKLGDTVIGSTFTNVNGTASLNYTLPPSLYNKTYTITATAIASETTLSSTTNATLTLNQLITRVNVPNISTKPSKTVVISATVLDEFNNYVSKGVVTFKKDGVVIGTTNVSNGFAKFTYTTNYETSNKTYIYASYVGDWKYASSSGNGTYEVTQLKTTLSASAIDAKPSSEITLKATIRDQNQNYATDGSVKFSINNTVIGTATVRNGIASLDYTLDSYDAGNYRIKAEYLGSKVYKNSSNTNTMTVTRYGVTLRGEEVYAVVGSESSITLSVTDEEKYNVKSGQVKYYINNEYIGTANVTNGVSTLYYVIPSQYDGKTVKYYATYEKNGVYDSSSYNNNLIVTHQKIVYVSPSGSDSNLGDKDHPFKTIEYALNHISLFGTIQLEAGTYYVSGLQLNTSINLIGSGRDKTFIDGQNSGKTVFNITKRNAVLTLDGVTIRNAKSNTEFSAGAIVTSSKLNIMNSRFVNNTGSGLYSGGAIYTNGILNITNTEFINNKVTNVNSQGGAIRCYDNITYITNCRFESNQVTGTNSTGAAAIYGDCSDIIINQTTFTKNIAKGTYITGGIIRTISGAVVIDSSTFTNNEITATDYAIGGVIGSLSSGISIMNSTISSNTVKATNSAGGSVAYVETAAMDIKDSKLNSNTVSATNTYGGAIYSYKANVNLINSQVNNNKLTDTDNAYGAAVYAYDGQFNVTKTNFTSNTIRAKTLALAGAFYSYSSVIVKNSTFEKNNINASSLGGGAIANMGSLTISNTNFINNSAYHAGDAITATTTAVNNIENNYWGSSNPTWSELLYSVTQPSSYSKTKL